MSDPGRPALCGPDQAALARNYCLLGASDAELAGFLGVAPGTVADWIAAHSDFRAAVQDGRAGADARVAAALYARALGWQREVERVVFVRGEEKRVRRTVRYPPDTSACIIWLRNRPRRLWGDQRTAETDRRG